MSRPEPPPFVDPTENVIALVAAAMQRQDDLREMQAAHAREMRETARRYEDRLDVKDQQLRSAEAGRLDAIQTRSDLTVQRAAEVQAAQQQALATQVTSTADTFRASIAAELAPIKASIEDLRRAQYEAQGKQGQIVETRDVHSESRLSFSAVIAAFAVIVAIVVPLLILYATKK